MFFLQESSARTLFPCTSYVSPLFLLTKLDEGPLFPLQSGGSSSLVRRNSEGIAEE